MKCLTLSTEYMMKVTPEIKPARPVLHHHLRFLRLKGKRSGVKGNIKGFSDRMWWMLCAATELSMCGMTHEHNCTAPSWALSKDTCAASTPCSSKKIC